MLTDKLERSRINEEVEHPEDLIQMSSSIISSPKVCLDLKTAHQKGDDAFVAFLKHRLHVIQTELNSTLRKMKIKSFTDAGNKVTTKGEG